VYYVDQVISRLAVRLRLLLLLLWLFALAFAAACRRKARPPCARERKPSKCGKTS
jgi:hypothetical protein